MPVDTRINIPFNPQEGITSQILTAIQLANEQHRAQQQLGIQQQQLGIQQQQAQSEIAQRGAETQKTQQETAANLPALQAQAEQARTAYQNLLTQIESEQNPLKKALLQGQAREQNANASLVEARAALLTSPQDFSKAVDTIIDPKKYPELNKRTKSQMQVAQYFQAFDPSAPEKVLAASTAEIGTIERETNPNVIASRVKQAVDTQRALYGGGAVSGVAPHLVAQATADATKAGMDYAQAQSVTQRLNAMMDAAKKGNVVSYQLIPQEGALQLTTSQGVHRINMAEIQNYEGGGSLWQRMEGHIGKELTGQSIPASVLKDMADMQKIQAEGARSKYENTLKTINKNYGSTFQPLDFAQSSPDAPAPPARPKGVPDNAAWDESTRTWNAP